MRYKFRVWMPLLAVFIVLLSIGTLLLYGLPAARTRLGEFSEGRALARAAAAAQGVETAGGEDRRRALDIAARTGKGEVLIVSAQARVVNRSGPELLPSPPKSVLRSAADGHRTIEEVEGVRIATVPIIRDGRLDGGLVFVPDEAENDVFGIFSRSSVEAAAIAAVLGGGLMLLVAALLSRRVERLTLGARSIERGNLSYRLEPGFDDELGKLAKSFNAMATKLEGSFSELEERKATLGVILDNLNEGVLATDLEGRVMFANPGARAMLGMGGEGSPEGLPNPWAEFDLPKAVARCAGEGECGEARVRGEETYLRVNLRSLPEYDEHGGGVLVVIQDLSEGRRLEANQQRFLANAAHELKTPLTTILGASDLLLDGDEDDPELRRRFLGHINAEARRMQRLSETLLRLARTGFDLREPDLTAVDPNKVARRVASHMEPLVESARLKLSVEGRGTRLRADEEWLEQALLVLLSNAVKHSHRGGQVRLRTDGATVAVEDEGEGMSQADLRHAFERFYQGAGSSGGFGLGLPICKELVERMGGKISIESEEGSGTTVKIRLPEAGSDA
ncbi:MAG: HAMP domain-containing protein [Rubrobacter sp.]|nr:HAMP domain-containing protein [Rubrobacter sp.]MDQ3363299.1 cell wall metabolism sensor histidine kinase WalK [Actinomycetota bacterium]